jgi:glycosyltransferase involved in cell wall biosynthesis
VRYEDFTQDPAESLRAVSELVGRPFEPERVLGEGPTTLKLPMMHTVSGNPSRFTSGDIAVRRDDAWREKMPRRQRLLVGAVTAPVQALYGYLRRLPEPPEQSVVDAPQPEVWPTVTAVVPTHNRPALMRRAVRSIIDQDYPGVIETIIVYDKAEPDPAMASDDPRRPVRVVSNIRAPGLAGARNTGILESEADLVAFCDDDDHWEPTKLRRQVQMLQSQPDAEFSTTAMVIDYEDRSIVRLAHRGVVTHQELLRSRMAMLHSSSFLGRRSAFIGGFGLVDETLPQSMAEDWDLLLRAADRHPIVHIDEPLVSVQWGPTSYFADKWQLRNEARLRMLDHHPAIKTDRLASGLFYGKLAYGSAMLGRRREALRWTARSVRANWREPRGYLAALVALRLISGQWIVDQLNRRGHGI